MFVKPLILGLELILALTPELTLAPELKLTLARTPTLARALALPLVLTLILTVSVITMAVLLSTPQHIRASYRPKSSRRRIDNVELTRSVHKRATVILVGAIRMANLNLGRSPLLVPTFTTLDPPHVHPPS